jgi:hypothetical protein
VKDWENRYAAVSLHQGLVLTLAEDRRYLAEARPLRSLIRQTLAPGVYLLSVSDSGEAAEALKKAGVDIVARRDQAPAEDPRRTNSSAFPPLEIPARLPGAEGKGEASPQPPPAAAEALKKRFHAALEKLGLPKQEQEELASRIERRLVLSEAQLAGAVIRYEKLEARGLDYVGKASIAKQAIAVRALVEVLWTGPGGEQDRFLGIPSALEKKDGENVLVLKPPPEHGARKDRGRLREEEVIRLPLGKISLLRRIKQSIFED